MAKGKELLARFKPGDNLPVYATGTDIAAGHFVLISGLNSKGAFVGAHSGAGKAASGVAETDAIAGKTDWRGGTNLTRRGSIARVVMGAAATVGDLVGSDSTGRAITYVPPTLSGNSQAAPTEPVILGRFLGLNLTAGGDATAANQVGLVDLY